MNEKFKQFLIEVSNNEELKQELIDKLGDEAKEAKEALKKISGSLAEFAKEKGFDVHASNVANQIMCVSDESLEEVSGGRVIYPYAEKDDPKGDCMCAFGGGGVADEYQKTCACVLGGGGELTDAGKAWFAQRFGSDYKMYPLFCILAGTSN